MVWKYQQRLSLITIFLLWFRGESLVNNNKKNQRDKYELNRESKVVACLPWHPMR